MGKNKHLAVRILYWLLQWSWGIIQNICGFIIFLALKIKYPAKETKIYNGAIVSKWKMKGSMGLGMFIFDGHCGFVDWEETMMHEYGHTIQSALLGPLYIPLIGIPSLIWANLPSFQRLRSNKKVGYMDLYCEKWASNWGEKALGKTAGKTWDV